MLFLFICLQFKDRFRYFEDPDMSANSNSNQINNTQQNNSTMQTNKNHKIKNLSSAIALRSIDAGLQEATLTSSLNKTTVKSNKEMIDNMLAYCDQNNSNLATVNIEVSPNSWHPVQL